MYLTLSQRQVDLTLSMTRVRKHLWVVVSFSGITVLAGASDLLTKS